MRPIKKVSIFNVKLQTLLSELQISCLSTSKEIEAYNMIVEAFRE